MMFITTVSVVRLSCYSVDYVTPASHQIHLQLMTCIIRNMASDSIARGLGESKFLLRPGPHNEKNS